MCEHEGRPCPGRSCRCECMTCMFVPTEGTFHQPKLRMRKLPVRAARHQGLSQARGR